MKRTITTLILLLSMAFVAKAQVPTHESRQADMMTVTSTKAERRLTSEEKTNVVPKSIFVEGLGLGLTPLSLNFETRFARRLNGWGLRVGGAYYGSGSSGIVTVPVQVNYLLGRKGRYFEMGAGTTFVRGHHNLYDTGCARSYESDSFFELVGTLTFGFRYQPIKGGFMFRAGFSPILMIRGKDNDPIFIPYVPYLSLGYSF